MIAVFASVSLMIAQTVKTQIFYFQDEFMLGHEHNTSVKAVPVFTAAGTVTIKKILQDAFDFDESILKKYFGSVTSIKRLLDIFFK